MLSADKGICVVVMDKYQYREKALSLLNDRNTYSTLKSDPTSKTQRKLNKMLLDLKKADTINEELYRMLYSSDGLSPGFYGLPKIHKTGIPLRAIVSFINSPTYDFSSYLAKILSPVVGNTELTISKIPSNLRILQEVKLLTERTSWYLSTSFLSLPKYQLI